MEFWRNQFLSDVDKGLFENFDGEELLEFDGKTTGEVIWEPGGVDCQFAR